MHKYTVQKGITGYQLDYRGRMGTSIQLSINLNKPIDCTYIHNGHQFDTFLTLRYGMFAQIFKIRENNYRPMGNTEI